MVAACDTGSIGQDGRLKRRGIKNAISTNHGAYYGHSCYNRGNCGANSAQAIILDSRHFLNLIGGRSVLPLLVACKAEAPAPSSF